MGFNIATGVSILRIMKTCFKEFNFRNCFGQSFRDYQYLRARGGA